MKAIINARAIVPDDRGDFHVLPSQAVLFAKNIHAILPMAQFSAENVEEIFDAKGCYASPGFINVHVHGCAGWDTMDDDERAIPAMQKFQASTGVTAFLPTTMTYDFPTIYRALERARHAMGKGQGASVLGCHMEGPFISLKHKGAQAEQNIAKADFLNIAPYQDIVKLITIAPEELDGDYRFVKQCQAAGILVSIGHSDADYDEAMAAIVQHGIRHVTHLFNAMTSFHHRRPGVVGAALDSPARCELIADNVHSAPAAQRIAYRVKGKSQLVLITDSLRACGLGDGESELGGQKVFVQGQLATLSDGTIAGSVLCMNRGIAIFRDNTGAPIEEVVEMATRAPAMELGIDHAYGSLAPGKRADIVVFDDAVQVKATIVGGASVYP